MGFPKHTVLSSVKYTCGLLNIIPRSGAAKNPNGGR